MLKRLFAALENFPSRPQQPPDFEYIVPLLLDASIHSTTPLSLKVARDVVVQGIPTILRKRKSITLALALAQETVESYWYHVDLGEKPFVTVDKVMLEIWSDHEAIGERTEENLEKLEAFRLDIMRREHVSLADFNGPLPSWHPSATHTGPSKLDRLLSVLGIDLVCAYVALHLSSFRDLNIHVLARDG